MSFDVAAMIPPLSASLIEIGTVAPGLPLASPILTAGPVIGAVGVDVPTTSGVEVAVAAATVDVAVTAGGVAVKVAAGAVGVGVATGGDVLVGVAPAPPMVMWPLVPLTGTRIARASEAPGLFSNVCTPVVAPAAIVNRQVNNGPSGMMLA